MSISLEHYCEFSESKFAGALTVALGHAIFLSTDDITIEKDDDEVRAYVDVMYSISKTEVGLINAIFDGLDWQISTSCHICTYRVIFYLTEEWL